MAAPTAPFCTSANVALLHPHLLNQASDFSASTSPKKTAVESMISLVSYQILTRFRRAGYKVPFVELSGETWPTDQTEFLRWLTILGVSNLLAGPAIANPGVRGRQNNPFREEFFQQLAEIYDTAKDIAMPWRAQYYSRTAAEKAIGEAALPMTDFLAEKHDPGLHYSFYDLTDKIHSLQRVFKDRDLDWDYAHDLHDLEKGFGRVLGEV